MSEGEQDDAQKTEDPTPKRIEESRKKGQVPMSKEVNNWLMLLMATILIGVMMGPMFVALKDVMVVYIARAHDLPSVPGGLQFILGEAMLEVLQIMALPAIMLMFVAFAGPFIQVGPLFAPESIKPTLSKISIKKGFGRLFSLRSLMEFAKGMLKISLIGAVGFIIIYPYYGRFEHLIDLPMLLIVAELKTLVMMMMTGMLITLFIIAMIDLVYQRNDHMKKMRMTRQEVKDEHKQSEGDPHVRGRLRQLRAEKARQRMMQSVPQADVIITNPTHFSIALKYKPEEMEAPVCVAKGVDEVALRIREIAEEHNIVLFENKPLARALYDTVDIDEMVPPEHFKAVAEVISYVFKLRGKIQS